MLAGQAQKEFFVNQALSIIDAVQHGAVRASLNEPPAVADEGDCYRVTTPAVAGWAGCEDHLAVRVGGSWHFISPREGMALFDQDADTRLFFRSGWHTVEAPAIPTGGLVIDVEARAALEQLIGTLREGGLLKLGL